MLRLPDKPTIAVIGATGAVGREMLAILAERRFPVGRLRAFASPRSAGTRLPFGDVEVVRPLTLSAWSNRLMLKADAGDDSIQVFYRESTEARPGLQVVDPRLSEFLPFLGHRTTVEKPYPGLGLSYGETIGAVHQLWRAGYLKADFKAEQDRVLAAIIRSQKEEEQVVRLIRIARVVLGEVL